MGEPYTYALTPDGAGAANAGGLASTRCLALAYAAIAFVKRGVVIYLSYRVKFLLSLVSLSLSILTFALVGRVVEAAGTGFAERYGTDYASFAIVGVAIHAVASRGLSCFRSAVRREQLQGTLETLFTSRLPASATVSMAGLGDLAMGVAGGGVFLAAAGALLGVRVFGGPHALPAVILYGAFMAGLGLASAGCVLVSKEGEPVSWLFGAASGLMGGVFFPVDLLPSWLARASRLLPTTHALALVRGTGGGPHGFASTSTSLIVLSCAAVLSLAVGAVALRAGYRCARRRGTLGEY